MAQNFYHTATQDSLTPEEALATHSDASQHWTSLVSITVTPPITAPTLS